MVASAAWRINIWAFSLSHSSIINFLHSFVSLVAWWRKIWVVAGANLTVELTRKVATSFEDEHTSKENEEEGEDNHLESERIIRKILEENSQGRSCKMKKKNHFIIVVCLTMLREEGASLVCKVQRCSSIYVEWQLSVSHIDCDSYWMMLIARARSAERERYSNPKNSLRLRWISSLLPNRTVAY